MLKKLAPVIVAAALVFGAAGCATGNVPQAKFQTALVKEAGLTKTQAACVSAKIYKKMSQPDINKLYTSATTTDLSNSIQDSFNGILASCNLKS